MPKLPWLGVWATRPSRNKYIHLSEGQQSMKKEVAFTALLWLGCYNRVPVHHSGPNLSSHTPSQISILKSHFVYSSGSTGLRTFSVVLHWRVKGRIQPPQPDICALLPGCMPFSPKREPPSTNNLIMKSHWSIFYSLNKPWECTLQQLSLYPSPYM